MQGHSNLRRQYVQATIALDVGSRRKPYLWIHWFNSVAFSYILEQSARRLPGYMLCHEGLLKLRKQDENQHTEYYKTLRIYLEENSNATQRPAVCLSTGARFCTGWNGSKRFWSRSFRIRRNCCI